MDLSIKLLFLLIELVVLSSSKFAFVGNKSYYVEIEKKFFT